MNAGAEVEPDPLPLDGEEEDDDVDNVRREQERRSCLTSLFFSVHSLTLRCLQWSAKDRRTSPTERRKGTNIPTGLSVRILFRFKVDPRDIESQTPLHHAALKGKSTRSSSPSLSPFLMTPLSFLLAEVVELLLRHGAAHSAVDESGLTPLYKV